MYPDTASKMNRAKDMINQEELYIVVVGEFNHGKTTFVNSLLRQHLLPTGILPTTATINIVGQGEEKIQVHKKDEVVSVKSDDLRHYIGDSDVSEIEWIGIRHPNVPFAPPFYIVDTPGLNDTNKKRSDVAYKFIPKADIIFFLLKADQPISETELSFLRDSLLEEGLKRIIFVMNFADAFEDEEEELEEMMEALEETLSSIKGIERPIIVPFDAKRALEDSIHGKVSDVDKLVAQIEKFQQNGLEELRLPRYEAVFNEITNTFRNERESYNQLHSMKKEELELIHSWIHSSKEANTVHFKEITNYFDVRQNDLLLMLDKSIDRLSDDWTRECIRIVKRYQGPSTQFVEVMQQDIEHMLSSERKRWVERYTPQIDLYIQKVQQEAIQSIADMKKQQTGLLWQQLDQSELSEVLFHPPFAEGKTDPTITAGLFAGGAAAVMLSLGGGLFMPFIGLAAYPIIRKQLETKALTEAKELMILELDKVVHQVLQDMKQSFAIYVENTFSKIKEMTLSQIENHYQYNLEKVEKQLEHQQSDQTEWNQQKDAVEKEIESEIEKLRDMLFQRE